MARGVLLSAGWLLSSMILYGSFLLLDLYWNVLNWRPRWDGPAFGLLGCGGLALIGGVLLHRVTTGRLSCIISMALSLFLLTAALHAFPKEPLSEGFVGREACSPLWYRGGRLLLFSIPALLWLVRFFRRCGIQGPGRKAPG